MVNFEELLAKKSIQQSCDPIDIFDKLDHQVGKESLRDAQKAILRDWFDNYTKQKDVLVKLHTGQGKTLIGLLMLKSSLCSGQGPAIYLCPNSFLVNQTIEQAKSFGIWTTQVGEGEGLPQNFLNSKDILVTTCHKMFNGMSLFGVLGSAGEPINVGAIVLDDAHKCLELIKQQFSIRVNRTTSQEEPNDDTDSQATTGIENPLYQDMWKIFDEDIRQQRPGTHSDILKGSSSVAAVPFWAWHDKQKKVIEVLQDHRKQREVFFSWNLIKDNLDHCYCLFSGQRFEINPRLLAIDLIPSFARCQRRIFLSATLTEDSFMVRDLNVEPSTIKKPLSTGDVRYSGERLIIIPTLVDTYLHRKVLIEWVARFAKAHGNFGVVALTPTSWHTSLWSENGAKIAYVKEIYQKIEDLANKIRQVDAKEVLVLINEYDGVDLPDEMCRILILDSLPSYSTLFEKYSQDVRPSSRIIRRQIAQRVEQGMGRAIRGPSDWCVVIVIGTNLVNFLSETQKRQFLSKEAQAQISMGMTLAEIMHKEGTKLAAIEKVVNQSISREPAWKEYYRESMNKIDVQKIDEDIMSKSLSERQAEKFVQLGQYEKAVEIVRSLAEQGDDNESGWYMQLMATYLYPHKVSDSMDKQMKAFEKIVCYSVLPKESRTRSLPMRARIKRATCSILSRSIKTTLP